MHWHLCAAGICSVSNVLTWRVAFDAPIQDYLVTYLKTGRRSITKGEVLYDVPAI